MSKFLSKLVQFTYYVDVNLFHNLNLKKLVIACLHFANFTLINQFTKKQTTVKTIMYLSKFVAVKTCVKQIIDLCNILKYLSVNVQKS